MNADGSGERYRRVEGAFQQALDLPADRRDHFLHEHCGADSRLRGEVEALLRSYQAAGSSFERPLYARAPAADPPDPLRIGRFEVRRRLGAGGMAVVYEVGQDAPRRSVAVKLLRPGSISDRSRGRIEFEAAVLARLQHPGIAHVYEAGFADVAYPGGAIERQPYFAMELVSGESLSRFVEARKPDLRRRLDLFLLICEAVEHAHQKGVIHRDLKPGNILVSESGQPKVLDFGVARITESDVQATTLPATGASLVGTPAYMSPEQVSRNAEQLDTRSDVYALGVILFELLTGALPYDVAGKPIAAAARVIIESPPRLVSRLNPACRGDLGTIVARALEKDPAERYASVNALSDDVRRFLRLEPIAARPHGALYSLRMFARRNRALAGGIAAAIAALLIGASVATYGLIAASHERDQKSAALLAELRARDEAEAVAAFLESTLAFADPAKKGRDARLADLLDASSAQVAEKFADRPLVQARLRHVIGMTYQKLGLYKEAEPHLRYALETRTAELGERHADSIGSRHELGALYHQWGRLAEAEPLALRAMELSLEVHGRESEAAMIALHEVALLYTKQSRLQEALPLREQSVELARKVFGEDHPTTLTFSGTLGVLYRRLGRFDESLAVSQATLAGRRRVLGEEHSETLTSMNNLAHLYRSMARFDEALELHSRTLEIRRRVIGDEHPQTALSMDNTAMLLDDLRRYEEAEVLYREALEHKRRIYGDDAPDTLVTLNNTGVNYRLQGRFDEAAGILADTLERRRRLLGDDHQETVITMDNLADALSGLSRFDEAERLLSEALERRKRVQGDDHPYTAESHYRLGKLYLDRGDPAAAIERFRSSLEIREKKLQASHKAIAQSRLALGRALTRSARFAEAEPLLLAAMESLAQSSVKPERIAALEHLAELYEAWLAAQPDSGHDTRAAEWRAKRDALDVSASP